jgi:hypothetical protein
VQHLDAERCGLPPQHPLGGDNGTLLVEASSPENWSFGLDLQILWKTGQAIIGRSPRPRTPGVYKPLTG